MLLEKHPKACEASNDILIKEEVQNVHPVIYDSIDSEMVGNAIKKHVALLALQVLMLMVGAEF